MSKTSSWEQQPDETPHAYAAARIYFELGPERTQRDVAARCGKSAATIARWSARYGWRARARAYDAYRLQLKDVERQRVLEQAAHTEAQKWFERLRLEREEEWETARALIAKAREMLERPLEDNKWNWRDAGTMIDQAARLVRLAASNPHDADAAATERQPMKVQVEYVEERPAARMPRDTTQEDPGDDPTNDPTND